MLKNKLASLKNMSILLVEDDALLSKNLEKTLNLFFKKVHTAKDGIDALKIFNNKDINMLITDYVMPIMNGYELCKEIRQINSNIPLVIISNFQDSNKLLNVIPLNITKYLIKPIEFTSLTNVLISMIEHLEKEKIILEKITDTIHYSKLTKKLTNDDVEILLTKNEIILIELFLKYKNTLVTNTMIEEELDKNNPLADSTIVNIIYRLRKKLDKKSIINIQNFGYILHVSNKEKIN